MANSLNITATDFTNDVSKAFASDVTMQLAIIDTTTQMAGIFYNIGKFKAEGKLFKVETEYAELLTGIPQALADKAPIKRTFSFEADLVNLQIENIALCLNAYLDDSGTNKRLIFGETIPQTLECSIILSGFQRDGKQLDYYIRKAQITPESVELMLGAPEFSSIKFQSNLIPDSHPFRTNYDWDVAESYDILAVTSDGTTVMTLNDSYATGTVSSTTLTFIGATVPALTTGTYDIDITIDAPDGGTVDKLNFSLTDEDDWNDVAAAIQVVLRTATSALETVVISDGKILVSSVTSGTNSAVLIADGTADTSGAVGPLLAQITSQVAAMTTSIDTPTAGVSFDDNVVVGDYIYSDANGYLGTVVSLIADTSITLDQVVSVETAVGMKGIAPADLKKDNIVAIEEEA